MTISRILYATDFSPASLAAWAYAKELSKVVHAELLILHVVPPLAALSEGFVSSEIFPRYWETARNDAEAELAKLIAEGEREALKARSRVEAGRPADQILLVATEEQVDLIVAGTEGRSGLNRALFGSVADELVRRSSCPVLTVGLRGREPRAARFETLLYPTDFSPKAEAAWPVVEALALASGGKIFILHIMPEVPEDPRISPTDRAKLLAGYRRRAEESVVLFLAKSPLPRSRVEVVLDHRVPAEEIVTHAGRIHADLIVMGTQGSSGLLRWVLGSVAHYVIQAAPCPVLTVGPESRKEAFHHGT